MLLSARHTRARAPARFAGDVAEFDGGVTGAKFLKGKGAKKATIAEN